jgi:acetolactate synthase-1/2/3 large subunit
MAASPIRTAAALLVDCLAAEQVEYVFSVPGEETMDILEALSRQDAVRHITTRHEQGAAFMADVYGRLTGRAAVAMSTLGPGATNLVTGIADAFLDRAPMVALTGQAGSDKIHKEAHQFVDIVRMLEPVTKWNQRVGQPGAIPEIVRKAFRVAQLAKPGPTHVELPENIAAMEVDAALRPIEPSMAYFPEPTDEAIAHAARLLAGSRRPLVLAGNGVIRRHAAPELRAFARGLHVPVAATFMGKGAIDDRSHLSLMAVGLQARDHVLSGFDRADVVMSVGYDLVEYAPARWRSTPSTSRRSSSSATSAGRSAGSWPRSFRTASAGSTPPRATRPARRSSTRTCARRCWPSLAPTSTTTGGRSGPRRRSRTCVGHSSRRTSSSATWERTRSG